MQNVNTHTHIHNINLFSFPDAVRGMAATAGALPGASSPSETVEKELDIGGFGGFGVQGLGFTALRLV